LQALFDSYISGDFLSVALEPSTMGTDIKRLHPGSAEVWEFKVTKTRDDQFRVFGRFTEVNVFVVLTGPVGRAGLNYPNEIIRC